jgi:serine/threonine protein kinase
MLNKIGKYEVSEQIGVGGFGAVYRGRDPFIKRAVAIKTCQVNDDEIKHRFFREAELAGNLHHRNITTIYDFGVENGVPYIVQEFLTGEDLDKKIKRGEPIPVRRKVEILMAITDGLGYAHDADIVHRDVKPANVRVLDDGTVKVMDFGIAKSLQSESSLTQTGITLGTSAYLAPEQIRGEPVDRRTDIFAMGTLAYELITYRKPFRGEHLSTILYKILNEVPEPIAGFTPDAPPSLVAAVMRAMAKTPSERFPSMHDFKRDLMGVYRELGGRSDAYPNLQGTPDQIGGAAPPSADAETTLATPSSGIGISPTRQITPPSGSLARVPDPADATPTSASIAGGDRPALELVNFWDPSGALPSEDAEATHAAAAARAAAPLPSRHGRLPFLAGTLAVIACGAVAYFLIDRQRRDVEPLPPPPPRAAPTAVPEFPEPKLGTGEPAAAAAAPSAPAETEAPGAPPSAAAEPTPAAAEPAEKPAPPKKFRIQFSSVPVATLIVDGKSIGPSIPARTLQLDEGEHTVRFESSEFPAYEKKFSVGSRSSSRIHYQFPVSMLVIQAPGWAGARVLVDGKYRGSLPDAARLKLVAGSYNVTLSREGMNPVTEQITVVEGTPFTWSPPPPTGTGGTQ